ncbi:uncharacterized protein BDR25DRAFT_271345 [Lindgomyces ingoldianus]|uniref:Uncharacterized protein n=1 Tax=Lindgomyces ingoldianus TaxID=673940 RepID=A0ACB6QCS2_9PLEO|nr:uncharacterized protein BDR25DRAFT_271345 [Lindgomyces ingoldianus]KAF2464716.1 hypothetical protein BDR25DRAFT_271345 [Lindgomyces ingoldianus]
MAGEKVVMPSTPEGGVMGLIEVDPSPVEETPAEFKEDYFPASAPSRTSTLGLGSHGPAYYLLRVQRYSSYAFTIFASFHIVNTSVIPLLTKSVSESNRYLLLTRPYYQSALTEPLLVGLPLMAHVSSGIALRLYRRHQTLRRYGAETHRDKKTIPWPAVSGTSALGFALIPLAGFHMLTTRMMPMYMHGDSSLINLSYISHGFSLHPFVSFAGFTALVGVGAWHITWGWAKWLRLCPTQATATGSRRHLVKKRRWYAINALSAVVAGLWLAGGLGIVGRGGKTTGWIGREFDELYKSMPLLGSIAW